MTPEQHYEQAEACLSEAYALRNGEDESETTREVMVRATASTLCVRLGSLHARLAEVGLQLRQTGDALAEFSEAHEVGKTDDTAERHDFPADVGKFGTGRNCRKCGRCEKHQGAECAGGQENSTAKTCLVCLYPMGRAA